MTKESTDKRPSAKLDGPSLSTVIRIDEKAARRAYDAARYRRMLGAALLRNDDPTMPKGDNAAGYQGDLRVANAERALLLAAADFSAATSWDEAAALFALFAATAQAKNPLKRKRGAPKKTNLLPKQMKLATAILTVQAHYPGLSRARIIREIAEMVKEGKIQLDGYVPSSGADLPTIEKRVKRSLAAALAELPKNGT